MGANAESHLSGSDFHYDFKNGDKTIKTGYDFVVSTTETSINDGLRAYFNNSDQPVQYLCFLVDSQGNVDKSITLEELLQLTKNVNPFTTPAGKIDQSIWQPLVDAKFRYGIKLQMGIPPGMQPKDLDIVEFADEDATHVRFRLYCSEVSIIELQIPSGWGSSDHTLVLHRQPPGKPWYAEMKVNLKVADLDTQLNTTYLNNHPTVKQEIKDKLKNLKDTAFSLQQLLYDLDSATLDSTPDFPGLDKGSDVFPLLQKTFSGTWSKSAAERGLPLVAITAVAQSKDSSQLVMSDYQRHVSLQTTKDGKMFRTLDYFCLTGNKKLPSNPSLPKFTWNWVVPEDKATKSGTMAINRTTFATYLKDQLVSHAKMYCGHPIVKVTGDNDDPLKPHINFFPVRIEYGKDPDKIEVTEKDKDVIHISYEGYGADKAHSGLFRLYGAVEVWNKYNCSVTFAGSSMTIEQHHVVRFFVQKNLTKDDINAIDRKSTVSYNLQISDHGSLQTVKGKSSDEDNSQRGDRSLFIDTFSGINAVVNGLKGVDLAPPELQSIDGDKLQSFIFPGSKAFAYKSVKFSDYQDIVCDVTYANPS
ncbi:hypothetical protein BDV32DRAFT_158018 [Aspergillus pseudonomiae]|nr:hypothetical protein BDV32DRAFT_158018 [Aspergillus pseudonomiae]